MCVCLSVVWYVDEVVIDTPCPPACTHTRTHRLSKYKESCIRHQLLLALWSHPILRHLANLSSKTQGKTKGSRFISSLFPFFCFVFAATLWLYVGTRFNFKEDGKSLPVNNFPHANGHVSRLAVTVRIKLAVKMKIVLISCSVTGIQMLLLHWNWCFPPVRHTCPVSTTVSRVNSRNRSMHNCTM